MSALVDMTGQRFTRLLVIGPAGSKGGRFRWLCRCDCGIEKSVIGKELRGGRTKSCGCLKSDNFNGHRFAKGEKVRLTHGHCSGARTGARRSLEYQAWCGAKSRCYNPRNKKYADYGGRGVIMCDRWRRSFETFLSDLGAPPTAKHSLDRIDPNGNYEPSNCRWATKKEQCQNKRLSAPRVAEILGRLRSASSDLLERAVLDRVRRELLGF